MSSASALSPGARPLLASRRSGSASHKKALNRRGAPVRPQAAIDSASSVTEASSGSAVPTYDVVVVGAGVSGLSTGFTLSQDAPGTKMLVTEARDRVGGNITSMNDGNYIWEEAGQPCNSRSLNLAPNFDALFSG